MAEQSIDFEHEVEFPKHPLDAARVFLGVMAYPERGAGQPGGLGVAFGTALWQYLVWSGRQAKGLRYVREEFGDPTYLPPTKRDFQGPLNRGLRRLRRRSAAYSLVGTQMLNGFFAVRAESARLVAQGRGDEAFVTVPDARFEPCRPDLWTRNTRAPRKTIAGNVARWSGRFDLNTTGRSADDARKAKDLVRRAYLQSRPVLHMAHALNQSVDQVGPTLDGWGDSDWLLLLLCNPERWVWDAIDTAMSWRELSRFHFTPDLEPDHMIRLVEPKNRSITHPAAGKRPAP